MDPERAGATRKAWLWAYHAPVESALVFDFNLSRGTDSPKAFFEDRGKGVIQTDGYGVYPAIFGERTDIELAGCMAHARRMWVKANESGDADAPAVLAEIQKLYRIEAEIRDTNPPRSLPTSSRCWARSAFRCFPKISRRSRKPAFSDPHRVNSERAASRSEARRAILASESLCKLVNRCSACLTASSLVVLRTERSTRNEVGSWTTFAVSDAASLA
jgi:hypothetical protein